MRSCEQTKGMSVLEHGFSVKNYLFDLLNHLRHDTPLKYEWCIPDWLYPNKDLILSSLPDDYTLKIYTIFHDIGKPYCLTIDEDGKRHFPNHSEVSYEVFKKHFNNDIAAELIRRDMDIHTLKSSDVEEFCKNQWCITSLIVGLAEIHSNCQMFGGTESTSFKIKKKSLFKNGNKIINTIKTKKNN